MRSHFILLLKRSCLRTLAMNRLACQRTYEDETGTYTIECIHSYVNVDSLTCIELNFYWVRPISSGINLQEEKNTFVFSFIFELKNPIEMNYEVFEDKFIDDEVINAYDLMLHDKYFRLPFYMSEFYHEIVTHYSDRVMYTAEKMRAVMHSGPPNESLALKIYSELLQELEKTVPLTISGKKYKHINDQDYIKLLARLRVRGFFLSIIAYTRWVKRCKESLYNPLRLHNIGVFRQIENGLVSIINK